MLNSLLLDFSHWVYIKNVEVDKNIMPEIELFPRLERVGHFIKRLVTFLPLEAPDHMSEHYRGGAALLDRELYDIPQETQDQLDYGTLE